MNLYQIEQDQDQQQDDPFEQTHQLVRYQESVQVSQKDCQFSQNRIPSPLLNNYCPFGQSSLGPNGTHGISTGTGHVMSTSNTHRSQVSDISQSYGITHQSPFAVGSNLKSVLPYSFKISTNPQDQKIGGNLQKIIQKDNQSPPNDSNISSIGIPIEVEFGGDTFQIQKVDQDAIMRSNPCEDSIKLGGSDEEESIQFMLSQSGGLETIRSKRNSIEGSFSAFNNYTLQTRLSKMNDNSDVYSISLTNQSNQKSAQRSIIKSNQKSGSKGGIPLPQNQSSLLKQNNGFGISQVTLGNTSPFQYTAKEKEALLNFSNTPTNKYNRDAQTDAKGYSQGKNIESISKKLTFEDPYDIAQPNIFIDEQDVSMIQMQLETTLKRDKARSSSTKSQSQQKLQKQNYLSYLDSNTKQIENNDFQLPQSYNTEIQQLIEPPVVFKPEVVKNVEPTIIKSRRQSSVISQHIETMLQETKAAQKKKRQVDKQSCQLKLKLKIKQSLKQTSKFTSRTNSSTKDQRLYSSRSQAIVPLNVFKNKTKTKAQRQSVATIDSGRTVEIMNNCQQSSAKIIDPTQILKRSRISKIKSNSVTAKSPMERGLSSSNVKFGSGSISNGSTGAVSQNRNKVSNMKIKIKNLVISSSNLKKSESGKIKMVVKSRNNIETQKQTKTQVDGFSNKYQPRPVSQRRMTLQVPNKNVPQNKENINTKNLSCSKSKISIQRKMSLQNNAFTKNQVQVHVPQVKIEKQNSSNIEKKSVKKVVKNTEKMKEMAQRSKYSLIGTQRLQTQASVGNTKGLKITNSQKIQQKMVEQKRKKQVETQKLPQKENSCTQCQELLCNQQELLQYIINQKELKPQIPKQ